MSGSVLVIRGGLRRVRLLTNGATNNSGTWTSSTTTTTTTTITCTGNNSIILSSPLKKTQQQVQQRLQQRFSSSTSAATTISKPLRKNITKQQREELRAARKLKAEKLLQEQGIGGAEKGASSGGVGKLSAFSRKYSRYIWYSTVIIPSGLLAWGYNDENSLPARFCNAIGLSGLVHSYTDEISKPMLKKLLPDWSQMPNVPKDIPVPHTLVLDLENTLIHSTWDRKYGWRHAKRPGATKFLHDMAQYYEIVLYSPTLDGTLDQVIEALDPDGCVMHRLFRNSTHFMNGVHVKDLNSLNRNVKRMIVIDDDPAESQLNPENLIHIKPYVDVHDRSDNTLERITPFLIEIAREGYNDIPSILEQYEGLDADGIATEYENRIYRYKEERRNLSQRGLGGFAGGGSGGGIYDNLPEPELPATDYFAGSAASTPGSGKQLTAKDIAGTNPNAKDDQNIGIMGWLNRRNKDKEELNMRKMEKWNDIMMKKQLAKQKQMEESA